MTVSAAFIFQQNTAGAHFTNRLKLSQLSLCLRFKLQNRLKSVHEIGPWGPFHKQAYVYFGGINLTQGGSYLSLRLLVKLAPENLLLKRYSEFSLLSKLVLGWYLLTFLFLELSYS